MEFLRPPGAPPTSLPADVRAALCGLAEDAGYSFVVQDSRGRTIFNASAARDLEVTAAGIAAAGIAPVGSVSSVSNRKQRVGAGLADPVPAPAPDRSLPLWFPGGECGQIGIITESSAWSAVHEAWLRAAARIARSTLKMASESDSMAGEIARAYEELSLLYSSSSRLSASEDLPTACGEALALAMHHIQARSAAIYLRHPLASRFLIAASDGEPMVWAPEVRPDPRFPYTSSLLHGQCILWEVGSESQMESLGILSAEPGTVICTPLQMDATLSSGIMGWLVFYGRKVDGPFTSNDAKVVQAVASQAAVSVANARLVEERQALLMGTIRSLAAAVDARDRYTHGHSVRVTDYTLAIARQLGCSEAQIQGLELAGLLHDVGKIGVPDRVLTKPGRLDEEEWSQMRRHPLIGAGIIGKVPGLDPIVQQGVRSHHERVDGSGYPDGLAGDQIPFAGRILSVADCFDAMTSDRPYRLGMSDEIAIQQMILEDGKQFEPAILAAFIEVWVSGRLQMAMAS